MCLHITGYKISDLPTLQKENDRNFCPSSEYQWLKPIGILAYSNPENRKRIYDAFGYPLFIEKELVEAQKFQNEMIEPSLFKISKERMHNAYIFVERLYFKYRNKNKDIKFEKTLANEWSFFTDCSVQSIQDGYILISITN